MKQFDHSFNWQLNCFRPKTAGFMPDNPPEQMGSLFWKILEPIQTPKKVLKNQNYNSGEYSQRQEKP